MPVLLAPSKRPSLPRIMCHKGTKYKVIYLKLTTMNNYVSLKFKIKKKMYLVKKKLNVFIMLHSEEVQNASTVIKKKIPI